MRRIAQFSLFFNYFIFIAGIVQTNAQVVSQASFLQARQKADAVVPFRILDQGTATPIEWGLDIAWLSEENIRRGVNYAGKDLIDIVRTSYMPTESVEGGELSTAQINKIRQRSTIIKNNLKSNISININDDHASVDSWYNEQSIGSVERGKRWAKVVDLSIQKYKELGLSNIVSISVFNEPDYGWDQGYSGTRMADFLNAVKSLKNDYDGAYDDVRMCGGNTLNCNYAYDWWNYMKTNLDEGNTHQLAGSFDNYASFFQTVREYGHHATADELHNTMEAMVGVEYGMQTGIWWGTCEHTRSQFMKATYHTNPGQRLGYAEHRNNWTAASVYRHVDGSIQAFGGTSERQAVETKYDFVSLDRPVWYSGLSGREYMMTLPGGTGYQQGQTNAETVVDIQSGDDIMPHIDGTYKVMNVNSGLIMGFSSNPSSGWSSATQKKNSTAKYLQWIVNPVPSTSEGDLSYYTFTLNTGKGMVLDILDWNMNAGANVGAYKGSLGTNEQWYLEYAGEGAFYIRSRFSTKCLEVYNGSKTISANIQMGDFKGEKYQQWRFIPTTSAPELVAPNAPTELTATSQASSIALQWKESEASDVATYVVLRSEDGTNYYAIANGLTGNTFTDNETADGVSYHYQVYAVDKCLNYSERTAAVSATCTGEKGLVAHLPFDYTLNDTTLNGNHSVVYGDTIWVEGKTGSALRFSGTDNFVQLPYAIANHDELTVACWIYWRGGSTWQRIWDFGTGTSQYMFLTPKCGSGMRFAIKDGGDEQQVNLGSNLPLNTWTHVTVTLGAEGATLYLNGEASATNPNVTIRPSDFRPVFNYIGRSQFTADPDLKGYVDDFRIYNYALSADEVKQLSENTDNIESIEDVDFNLDESRQDMSNQNTINGKSYDLSGRRIPTNTQLHKKGIFIKKGRKSLVY